ncbi:MAG: diguanylate cyclase [Actinobacteria bacterium]|nr:diguanylate cyclase [Actinomycetota bacterium]
MMQTLDDMTAHGTQTADETLGGGISSALVYDEGGADGVLLGDTLVKLAEHMAHALECSECCIYEYLPERNALRTQALWSRVLRARDVDWVGEMHQLDEVPGFERVVKDREVLCSYPDDEADKATAGFETMEYWGELATIWAPIVYGDRVLGMLELTEKEHERRFSPADERLAEQMAALAGVALHNAKLSRAASEHNRQLTALIHAARAMTSTLDLDELLQVVCRQAARALDAAASYIYSYDADADALVWLAEYQADPSHATEALGTVYPVDDLPHDQTVVRARQAVEVRVDDPDIDAGALARMQAWGEQSSLVVPLAVGGTLVGALAVSETAYPRHFTEQETALCVALGEQAAVAIHNAELYRRLQEQKETIGLQATVDGLTGLANHRHFWDRLRDEVARAQRYDQPLSLLMLDLDDFKRVNDRFGHLVGDELLRGMGHALRSQVRQGVDCAARYGGEEFAVILPSTRSAPPGGSVDGAVATAERIRAAVAALESPVGDPGWPGVTVSIGVATLPLHAETAEELVTRADQALYWAKARGKDTVAVYGCG